MNNETVRISFIEDQSSIDVKKGTKLFDVMLELGKIQDAPCGGNGKCGKCKVIVNGEEVLACQTKADHDMEVKNLTVTENNNRILSSAKEVKHVDYAPGNLIQGTEHPYLAAIDIGTTTVVAYLIDGITGKTIASQSLLNPQRKYGADVVARCSYSMEHGKEHLSSAIREAVDQLLLKLTKSNGCNAEQIIKVMIVGNTGMHHLFLEYPTDKLALAPYVPYVKDALTISAKDCNIHIHPEAEIVWLPNIGGFVGADTSGCLVATNMADLDKMTLMVDIGTNGEMVLGNKDGLLACSTAAGPAFEGAKITCGMHGSDGAIDKVYIENGKIRYHVIGEKEAIGICGSGLLDAASCLLAQDLIDETGRLEETYYFNDNVFLNQKDIRELQLAKAAIAAGIEILCMRKGIQTDEIEQILLAGAFGNYLDPESACAIGLLPAELKDRIIQIGNAAGEGAQIALKNNTEFEKIRKTAAEVGFLELAVDPDFQDIYVDQLGFGEEYD